MFHQQTPCLGANLRASLCVTVALVTYSCCLAEVSPQQQQQQQQQLTQATDSGEFSALSNLLMLEPQTTNLKKKIVHEQSERAHKLEEKHRFELKRRLHKLIDELVDTKLNEQQQQTYPAKQQAESFELRHNKARSKKWNNSNNNNNKEQELGLSEPHSDGGDKIMIIVKQPSSLSADNLGPAQLIMPIKAGLGGAELPGAESLANNLDSYAAAASSQQQQQQQSRRPKIELADNARRIMSDDFGIRRESLFSTNNHLGSKGVPKFGSEEEY